MPARLTTGNTPEPRSRQLFRNHVKQQILIPGPQHVLRGTHLNQCFQENHALHTFLLSMNMIMMNFIQQVHTSLIHVLKDVNIKLRSSASQHMNRVVCPLSPPFHHFRQPQLPGTQVRHRSSSCLRQTVSRPLHLRLGNQVFMISTCHILSPVHNHATHGCHKQHNSRLALHGKLAAV